MALALLGSALLAWGCVVDWDQYDRRLGSGQGGSGATSSGGGGGGSGGTAIGGAGGMGGTVGTGGSGGEVVVAPWFNESYVRRRRLSFASQLDTLTQFPVLVALDEARINYGLTQAAGEDLRFVSADSATVLAHEIETWDPNGVSVVWVKVPVIAAASPNEHIWMYYGNPSAGDGQDAVQTWAQGYSAVWHMTASLVDSTGHGNDGADSGSAGSQGFIGAARRFDGAANFVGLGSDVTIDNVFNAGGTISAWIQPVGWGGNDLGRILDKSTSTSTADGWSLLVDNAFNGENINFVRRFDDGPRGFDTLGNSISLDQWQWVTVVYDDSAASNVPSIYIDGVAQNITESGLPTLDAADDDLAPMRIGNYGTGTTRGFDGGIDEVRVSAVPRTAAWVAAQYASMTGALISYGAEESL